MTTDIRDRISMVRESQKKSQEEFGSILGVTKSTISLLETKKREPSERLIRDICREFNVNEEWLRSGIGGNENMFISEDVKYFQNVEKLGSEKNEFKKFYLNMMMKLPDEYWDYIYKEFKKFDKSNSNDVPDETIQSTKKPKSGFEGIPSSDELLEMYPDLLNEDEKGIS